MKTTDDPQLQFLNPGGEISDPRNAKVAVLPLPLEKTTSYMKGTANGPRAIVEASTQVEFFDPELVAEPCQVGVYTDWELGGSVLHELPMEAALEKIRTKTRSLLDAGKFVLALGGEHTITVGLIDPYLERWKGQLTVVHVDAHADMRDQYEGTPYSHACAMRRLSGRVPIVSAGIRALEWDEYKVAPEKNVKLFFAHDIRRNPNWVEEFVASIKTPYVYLTVDLDGLDPSIIPSVGTPVPGGLQWEETLRMIRLVSEKHRIVGADVNELCPNPAARWVDFSAASLCYKIIGYVFAKELKR